jgi:hypothetical protein
MYVRSDKCEWRAEGARPTTTEGMWLGEHDEDEQMLFAGEGGVVAAAQTMSAQVRLSAVLPFIVRCCLSF